ncbi:ATP-binding cassette subfamily B protein [Panacagrimonas perspica]|uniref:ATP-binding cassette subfamily B protein n=1 Tax=Panacagrimonas perspica TaxID=381431 RepID=A0A4S3K598_9GAMM|nr:ABC transporter ATP-binding protein/permease [Panacagrimonas perspica]TDU31516.1 ATP-binding cassette subfamily B protein [Panacagrimonas perspica]THD03246.1 metal ABC transporter permease [Panacagrimonas perspica]
MRPRAESSYPGTVEPKPSFRVVGSLLPYLKEFPGRVFIAAACLVLAKLGTVAMPLVLKHIVDDLDAGKHAVLVVPIALLLFYGLLRFANVILGELRDVVFGRVSERAMRRASLDVFRHLHRQDMEFHLGRRTGGVARDIERGVAGISFLLRFMLFNILPTLLELGLVAAILLFEYGASFATITALSVGGYVLFSVSVTEWRTKFVREANRLDSRASQRSVDSLLNYETVKLFGAEEREAAEYDRFLEEWERAQQQNRVSLAALNLGQAVIVAGGMTWMMILAARGVAGGGMTLGDFVAINAYMIQLFIPLNFLGFVYREIRRALVDMQRMFDLVADEPKVADAPDAQRLALERGHVRFEDVSFAYRADRPILDRVSFDIAPGRKLAVVGASGAGKSTLARLLLRFYDPQGGRVTIDGTDIRRVTQASLRSRIGVVPQDTVLFNDTLAYNLQYGAPQASAEELDAAIRTAHLDRFVATLPEGLQTQVGERGLKLSGGEKQRVAIARALLKNPKLLIFDEATSSLDSASERAILVALREAAEHRTTLVIAHRLSTITDADEILVLDHGRISERGSHDELLQRNGAYAALWNLQLRERATGPREAAVHPV